MKLLYGELAGRIVSGRIAAAVATTADLTAIPAANREDGMLCLVADVLYRFDDSSAVTGAGALAPDSGTGRWILVDGGYQGADLGDADANLQISAGAWRKIPAATLSADRTYTLVTTGAVAGDVIDVTRLDATAHQAIFVNGGTGGGTLLTMPASKVNSARFQFDGTDWELRLCGAQ